MKRVLQVFVLTWIVSTVSAAGVPQASQAGSSWGISIGSGGTGFPYNRGHHGSSFYYGGWYTPHYGPYPPVGWMGTDYHSYYPGYVYAPGFIGFHYDPH